MSKCVIILGMHRGGTSLTANLLSSYGVQAGNEKLLMKANADNPRGYWEYLPLVEFNDELLGSVGAKWCIPPSDEGYKELERKSSDLKYRGRALRLMESMQKYGCPWFWKDPRLAVLLPFWKNIWGDVIYIIPLRHPLDIALSLKKRNNYPISASLLIWQRYMLAILKGTETAQNKLFVEYERLIVDPIKQCNRLYVFLNRYFKAEVSKQQAVESMVNIIAPELRHNCSSSSLSSVPQATAEQKALFIFLKGKTKNIIDRLDQPDFSAYAGWREYLLTIDTMLDLWFLLPQKRKQLAFSQMSATLMEQFGVVKARSNG